MVVFSAVFSMFLHNKKMPCFGILNTNMIPVTLQQALIRFPPFLKDKNLMYQLF